MIHISHRITVLTSTLPRQNKEKKNSRAVDPITRVEHIHREVTKNNKLKADVNLESRLLPAPIQLIFPTALPLPDPVSLLFLLLSKNRQSRLGNLRTYPPPSLRTWLHSVRTLITRTLDHAG